MRASILPMLFVALVAGDALAAPEVQISADSRRIYVGLPFELQVAATGFDESPQPEAPELAIDGCQVSYAGVSPRVSRSLSIVNGVRSQTVDVTFVYRYRVTPSAAKTYQIPAVEVVQGGKRARSRPAKFTARAVPRTDKMKLRLGLPERPVWLGETFEMTVDWYVSADPSRPSFSIPLFSKPGLATVRAPEGADRRKTVTFAAGDHEVELPYTVERATLDGAEYSRLRFKALVTPQQAGAIELEPAAVVSELEVGVRRDSFFPRAETAVFMAEDKARILEVKALPQTGRPASFNNAVGSGFAIDVEASRTVVRVGEPIELEISLRGDVPLAGIALPKLDTLLPAEQFELPDAEPVGQVADGKKIFRVTARLKSADAREIPPIELSYFNPETGSYEVARSQPIALQVAGSAVVGSQQVASAANRNAGPGGGDASLVGADLSLSAPGETLDTPVTLGQLAPLLAGLYALPLLVFAIAWYRRKTAGEREIRSARKARRREALEALERAEREPGGEVASELAAALRKLARERGFKPDGFAEAIAELETTAYNPRADDEPLPRSIRERCRALVAAFGVLVLVGLVGSSAWAAGAEATLDRARAVYREALAIEGANSREKVSRFAEAAKAFGEVVRERGDAPELLVDWGNASLGAREPGWAVLAYRRALHLDRGVSRARRNLNWVRGSLGDWPTVEAGGAIDSLLFWHRSWNVTSRHLAAAICFALALILLMPWRPALFRFWARITAGFVIAVFAALLLSALFEPDHSREAVVVADGVSLRSADVAGAPAVIARPLPAGLEVDLAESRDRWVQIVLADGRRGWVPRSAIAMVVE